MKQNELNIGKSQVHDNSDKSFEVIMTLLVSILLTCGIYALLDQILNFQIPFVNFLSLIFSFFILFCMANIFIKANEAGWKVFIPIYNVIVLLRIVGKPEWWIILLLIPGINIVFSIWVTNLISLKFGKDEGFTFGLILLPFIFYPILAYGKSQYIKKVNDQKVIIDIAKNEKDHKIRIAAVNKVTDQKVLANVAKNDDNPDVREAAIKKVTDQKIRKERIEISGGFLKTIYDDIPVTVYANLDEVIEFFKRDKFPYLWPNDKDYVEFVNENESPQEELKYSWLKVYLYHPDPLVRKAVVELNAKNDSWSISQTLCDLLDDPDENVRDMVYKITWQREKDDYCKPIIEKLSDEIKGTGMYSTLGQEKAIKALKKIIAFAPDYSSKKKILENIKSAGLNEYIEKTKVNKKDGSVEVKFIKKIKKEEDIMGNVTTLTYEIYSAANKKQAIDFIKTKSVTKDWYFIEVNVGDINNPDVVIGLDINGQYET